MTLILNFLLLIRELCCILYYFTYFRPLFKLPSKFFCDFQTLDTSLMTNACDVTRWRILFSPHRLLSSSRQSSLLWWIAKIFFILSQLASLVQCSKKLFRKFPRSVRRSSGNLGAFTCFHSTWQNNCVLKIRRKTTNEHQLLKPPRPDFLITLTSHE